MRRLASLRARTTLGACLVVAVALVVVGVVLVAILRSTLHDNIDNSLQLRVRDLDNVLSETASPGNLAVEGSSDGFAQIVDDRGRVLAASANVRGEPPLSDATPGTIAEMRFSLAEEEEEPYRVLLSRSTDPSLTIIVGRTLEDVHATLGVAVASLAVGFPLLLLLVAGTTWAVAGRTLGPVEAIRSEVEAIGGSDLHRRVPQPGSEDEIDRLAATMNAMLARLEEANERQQRFVSDASHELRTPIATIRHEAEVALLHPAQTDVRVLADGVLEEDLRMQRLVDDLLWLARNDQTRDRSRRRTLVDLDELATTVACRTRSAGLSVGTSGIAAGQVRGDPDELRRVLDNLIDNARRHATSTVEVSVASADGFVVLAVEDDGAGVGRDQRERIFERFTRSDDARARDAGGAGLGLAIVAEIVRACGASVAVDQSPALGGALFSVRLPDARAEVKVGRRPVTALG